MFQGVGIAQDKVFTHNLCQLFDEYILHDQKILFTLPYILSRSIINTSIIYTLEAV